MLVGETQHTCGWNNALCFLRLLLLLQSEVEFLADWKLYLRSFNLRRKGTGLTQLILLLFSCSFLSPPMFDGIPDPGLQGIATARSPLSSHPCTYRPCTGVSYPREPRKQIFRSFLLHPMSRQTHIPVYSARTVAFSIASLPPYLQSYAGILVHKTNRIRTLSTNKLCKTSSFAT